MIQIDDAGSGSLVGGTCIGAIRVETGEYFYSIIPVELYNEENFKTKAYIRYTSGIVHEAIEKLRVSKEEPILICQGYMFEHARACLKEKGFNYKSSKIEDPLQSIIEKTFEDYTISLGLPKDFITYTKYPFHFHRLLRWVYADYANRIRVCKTGWKSWSKYSDLQVETYFDKVAKSNFICLKCGKKIRNNTTVKVIKFMSNRPNVVYLHKNCGKESS